MAVPAQVLRYHSALSLITRALKFLGELAAEETPTASAAQDAWDHLQDLMDEWKTQRLTIPALLRTVKVLASGVPSYTIGIGGDINIVMPTVIEHATIIIDQAPVVTTEVPISVLSDQQWADMRQKLFTGAYPQGIYFDRVWDTGLSRIWVYPIPTGGAPVSLVIYTPLAFTDFASLVQTYSFPPGYATALRLTLAKKLAPEYGRPWTGEMDLQMRTAVADMKRMNFRPRELTSSYPDVELARPFNIYTGDR